MYTHLHTHSYYSFLNSTLSPRQLVKAAVEQGMPALALTDLHGLTGAIESYDACYEAGIKPILGLELVANHPLGQGHLVFLATDMAGWTSLCRLSSTVQTYPQRDPERGIDFDRLAGLAEGLICLTGSHRGLLNRLVLARDNRNALRFLDELHSIFPDRLYIELQQHSPADQPVITGLVDLARGTRLPTVATHNIEYLLPDQAGLQRTLTAIRLNCPISELSPDSAAPTGSYFLPAAEITQRFKEIPMAIANVQEIIGRCNLTLPLGKPYFPQIPLPPGETAASLLRKFALAGVHRRYGRSTPEIEARLDHELNIINQRGYAPLFIIMQEILDYAHQTGVPISSRGSAASSLVAYCLGITTPDPLALDLYFERFLNPARETPPDIDTDLCSRRRDGVLQHVYQQYGPDRVAMVATINRFQPRSALREVSKAHGLSPKEISRLVAQLPYRGWGPPGRRAKSTDPFESMQDSFPQQPYPKIFHQARLILKIPRHLSVHPGGIVIAPTPLTDRVPIHLASKGMNITQFDLESIERLGLVKIDLLGTRGLTVQGDVAEKVSSWRRTEYPNTLALLESIPLQDEPTTDLVAAAQTIGCFQIESPGMRATLREIDARTPKDLMIALALYRPGPMTGGLKDAFVRRHLKREPVEHLHPSLAPLLDETYGVILYQEQVLLIASRLAGLSLADADLLRRAMSHFDPGERMKSLKLRFVQGAQVVSGVPEEIGEHIWDLMAAFAGYGFPKAHAASYAQVSWRSAWCKAHYPAEFMAAVLAGWGGYYRQRVYLNEARRLRLPLHPPHINHADHQFSVKYPGGDPNLYMGLDQVKGLTRHTQTRILQNRPFHSLPDFLLRVDPRPQEVKDLIQAGCLKGLGTIPNLLRQVASSRWAYRQYPLFELELPPQEPEWDLGSRLEAQMRVLRAYVDAHPIELVADQGRELGATTTLEALSRLGEEIKVLGIRQTTQRFYAHQGEPFYILELEDLEGVLPVMMTPAFYRRQREALSGQKPFVVVGKMEESAVYGEPVLQAVKIIGLQ